MHTKLTTLPRDRKSCSQTASMIFGLFTAVDGYRGVDTYTRQRSILFFQVQHTENLFEMGLKAGLVYLGSGILWDSVGAVDVEFRSMRLASSLKLVTSRV